MTIKEFKENGWDEEKLGTLVESDFDLSRVSPYYDCGYDDAAIIGVVVMNAGFKNAQVLDMHGPKIDAAFDLFKQCTGLGGKLYLSPDVW